MSLALSVWNQNTLKTRKATSFLLNCREESLQRSQIIFLRLRVVQAELGFCPVQLSSSVVSIPILPRVHYPGRTSGAFFLLDPLCLPPLPSWDRSGK